MSNTGWFADIDKDNPVGDYQWQPCLQLNGMCTSFDIHFRTRKECEEFIRDEVIGQGWIPGDPIDLATGKREQR